SLADVGGAAEDRDSPAAIDLDLHAGVRHRVPVDGQPGAGEIGRAGEPDAAPGTELPTLVVPAAPRDHVLEARGEADRADPHLVGGDRVRRERVVLTPQPRVEAGVRADLVDVALERVAGLGRAVAALGAAGRLVREDADALELVARDAIRDRLERAGVVEARDAVAPVAAPVEGGAEVHRGDRPVLLHP